MTLVRRSLWVAVLLWIAKMVLPVRNEASAQGAASVAFVVEEKDLVPEGIAYDPQTRQFFLSSINKHKVVVVDRALRHSDFVRSNQDGMLRSLGLKVDVRRRRLWVLSNAASMSFVHVFDIDTRRLLASLSPSVDGEHLLNDLALAGDGSAYITDSRGSGLFHVPAALDRLELFVGADSLLAGVNGISISSDESFLYVASESNGLQIVDIGTRSIRAMENWLAADTRGIDGLMLYENSLVAVRNGASDPRRHHLTRYRLSANGREIRSTSIIDHRNPVFNVPTTGVIVDGHLFCLAVTNLDLFLGAKMAEVDQLRNPVVLRYRLER